MERSEHSPKPQAQAAKLDTATRAAMESAFGTSFSEVNVHTGAMANHAAEEMGASAYTVGRDVVFGAGQFDPFSPEGRTLLAHELAHVVQQRRGTGDGGRSAEADADTAAFSAATGGHAKVGAGSAVGVACAEKGYLDWARDTFDEGAEYAKKKAAAALDYAKQRGSAAIDTVKETANSVKQEGEAALKSVTNTAVVVPPTQAPPPPPKKASLAAKESKRVVKKALGVVEGVTSEVTNLADTGIWAYSKAGKGEDYVFGKLDDAAKALGLNEYQRQALEGATRGTTLVLSGGTVGNIGPAARATQAAAEKTDINPETKKPIAIDPVTGTPTIAPVATSLFNYLEKEVDEADVFAGTGKDDQFLTDREQAAIASSVGVQVVLAETGGEEVQLGLKAVGALGSLKNLEAVAMQSKQETGSYFTPQLCAAIAEVVLFVIGLTGIGAKRKLITLFMDTAMNVLPETGPVLKLAVDLETANPPERADILRKDFTEVVMAAKPIMVQIIRTITHAGRGAPGRKTDRPTAKPGETENPPVAVKVEEPQPDSPPGQKKSPYRENSPPPAEESGPVFPIHEKPAPAPEQAPAPEPAPAPALEPAQPASPPTPAPGVPRRRIDPAPFRETEPAPGPRPDRFQPHPRFGRPKGGQAHADEFGVVGLERGTPANDHDPLKLLEGGSPANDNANNVYEFPKKQQAPPVEIRPTADEYVPPRMTAETPSSTIDRPHASEGPPVTTPAPIPLAPPKKLTAIGQARKAAERVAPIADDLRSKAATSREAGESLRDFYEKQSDAVLAELAKKDPAAQEVLDRRGVNVEAQRIATDKKLYRGPHDAVVRVMNDADGSVVREAEELHSGGLSDDDRSELPHDPLNLESHTEAKAVRTIPLHEGETMFIDGSYDPCNSCRSKMQEKANATGGRVVYWWQGGRVIFVRRTPAAGTAR